MAAQAKGRPIAGEEVKKATAEAGTKTGLSRNQMTTAEVSAGGALEDVTSGGESREIQVEELLDKRPKLRHEWQKLQDEVGVLGAAGSSAELLKEEQAARQLLESERQQAMALMGQANSSLTLVEAVQLMMQRANQHESHGHRSGACGQVIEGEVDPVMCQSQVAVDPNLCKPKPMSREERIMAEARAELKAHGHQAVIKTQNAKRSTPASQNSREEADERRVKEAWKAVGQENRDRVAQEKSGSSMKQLRR